MGKYPNPPAAKSPQPPTYEETVGRNEPAPNTSNAQQRHDTFSSSVPPSYLIYTNGAPTTMPPNSNVILATVPRSEPILVNCPLCLKLVTTEVEPVSGSLTWLSCLGIAFLGGVWGCCLIPFCIPKLMDVRHKCPACHAVIAKYERL